MLRNLFYFQSHVWGMKREPIKTPFLHKNKESDYRDSLSIFKLILRFMNDDSLTDRKEQAYGDYIAYKVRIYPLLYCFLFTSSDWKIRKVKLYMYVVTVNGCLCNLLLTKLSFFKRDFPTTNYAMKFYVSWLIKHGGMMWPLTTNVAGF